MAEIVDPFKQNPSQPSSPGIVDPFVGPSPVANKVDKSKQNERSWGQAIGDTALGVAAGAANLVGGLVETQEATKPTNIVRQGLRLLDRAGVPGASSLAAKVPRTLTERQFGMAPGAGSAATSKGVQMASDAIGGAQSDALQQEKQELAETEGFIGSAKKVLTSPRLLANFMAEQVPNIATMGVGTRLAAARAGQRALGGVLAKGLGTDAAETAAAAASKKAATTAATGMTTVMEAGQAGQQTYQQAMAQPQSVWDANPEYQRMIAAGADPVTAKETIARGASLQAQAITVPIAAVAGRFAAPFEAEVFTRQLARRPMAMLQGAARETVEETIQEGGSQFAGNVAQRQVDPNQGVWEGVPEAAGTGAALGAVLGGGMSAGGALASERRDATAESDRGLPPNAPQDDLLALPAPAPTVVSPDGTATTPSQAYAQQQADVAFSAQRDAAGLSPDVNAARTAHPGAAPNAPTDMPLPITRALPAPTAPSTPFAVDADGVAVTPQQAFDAEGAQLREAQERQAADIAFAQQRSDMGLTPDVNRARARHPAAAPALPDGSPIPDPARGVLSRAVNIGVANGAVQQAAAEQAAAQAATAREQQASQPLPAQVPNALAGNGNSRKGGRNAAEVGNERAPGAEAAAPARAGEQAGRPADEVGAAAQQQGSAEPVPAVPAAVAGATSAAEAQPALSDAGARWTRATTSERVALLSRAGLSPALTNRAFDKIGDVGQKKLAAAMDSEVAAGPGAAAEPQSALKKQVFTGRTKTDGKKGASIGSIADGTRRQLMVDPDGGYFWGDYAEASDIRNGGDLDSLVIEGEHAGFKPATFDRDAEARAAAESTPQSKTQPSGGGSGRTPQAAPAPATAVDVAAAEAATSPTNDRPEPTRAQKDAGNYKKGHARVAGLDISIENPAGSSRRPEWPPLKNHYGYFKGTKGADKDHVDVFMTDRAEDESLPVFVVDQVNKDGSFDEHKVVMGAPDEASARAAYLSNYAPGWTGLGGITQMTQDEFKAWVKDPAKTVKPAAQTPTKTAAPALSAVQDQPPTAGNEGQGAQPTNPVHTALRAIADGRHPEQALQGMDDAGIRAVGEAMGRRFSPRASAAAIAERLGEVARSDWMNAAQAAVSKLPVPAQPAQETPVSYADAPALAQESAPARPAQDKARKPATKTDKAGKPMDLLRVIAAGGGLNRAAWAKQGVDPAEFTRRAGFNYVFRKQGGMTPSDLREFMQQEGYLAADHPDRPATVEDNDAIDLFDRAFRGGEEIFSPDQQEAVARWREAEQQAEEEYRAEKEGADAFDEWMESAAAPSDMLDAPDVHDLLARAEALGATETELLDAGYRGVQAVQELIDRLEKDNADSAGSGAGDGETSDVRRPADTRTDGSGLAQRRPGAADEAQAIAGDLFGRPSAREEVEAERRRRDAERDGKTGTGRTDMAAGAGELFAGPRPVQADIEQATEQAQGGEPPVGVRGSRPAPDSPATEGEAPRGHVGQLLGTGDVVTTSSGRETTPFPRVDTSSGRKQLNSAKRAERWLMENALAEAEARGDEFNARQFRANIESPSQADKDGAEEYLFGEQPDVVPPVTKRVETAAVTQPAPAAEQVKEQASTAPALPQTVADGLAAFGYTLDGNEIVSPKGKNSGVTVSLERGRAMVRAPGGKLLWSGKPERIGDFPASYWHAERVPASAKGEGKLPTTFDSQQGQAVPAAEASKTPLLDLHVDLMSRARDGSATPAEFQQAFAAVADGMDALVAELSSMTKEKLLNTGGGYFASRYKGERKADVVKALAERVLAEFALGRSYGPTSYVMTVNGMAEHQRAKDAALRELVANTTEADLKAFADEVAQARAEVAGRKEAQAKTLADPQTLADFKAVMRHHIGEGASLRDAYLRLTPEQRQRYDALAAESTRDAREKAKAAQRPQVAAAGQATTGRIVETQHTRDGYDLFVVQLGERVSREDYNTLNTSAKRMGGWYSKFRGNGAVPGFQFKTREAAEAFSKLVAGDAADATVVADARRDAFADDRSQSAVERLRDMADALAARADEALGRDRKANTARRARMAAGADAAARADKALAGTMRNLADAIEAGDAKFLDAVRQKVQVELLAGELRTAKDAQVRAKYPTYLEQEQHRGEPVDDETVDFATFPTYGAMRSDLAGIARQMLDVDGLKKLGAKLLSVADDVSSAYTDWAKQNLLQVSRFGRAGELAEFASRDDAERALRRAGLTGRAIVLPIKRGQNRVVLAPSEAMKLGLWDGDGDKRINLNSDFGKELVNAIGQRAGQKIRLPWGLESTHEKRKRLEGMGIFTAPEYRSALREFAGLQEAAAAPDKIREMERSMIGRRNDGLDFFPTSAEVVDTLLEAAGIEPGMTVLEPSAGMGHIADAIRDKAGVDPDVVELSGERRELLEAKGYPLVGKDFMEVQGDYDRIVMNPPFSKGRDIQHVQHAYELLRPGGRLVAIMGEGAFFQSNKSAEGFRQWLDDLGATSERLPEGSFMDPALPVNTGANARLVVIDKPAGGDLRFSQPDAAQPQRDRAGLSVAQVRHVTDRVTAGWGSNAPKVQVVQTAAELPARATADPDHLTAEGFYDEATGTVYLVADNLRSPHRALQVLAHEAVGHYGIEAITGPELWAKIGQTIETMRASGLHAELFAEIDRRYRGANRDIAVREAVAVMTEKGISSSVLDRVVAAVRRFLRQMGFRVEFSEAELRQHLAAAARYVRGGSRPRQAAAAGNADLAFSRTDIDPNREVPVVGLAGGIFGDTTRDAAGARRRARDYLKKLRDTGNLMTNDDTGWKIGLSGKGINELASWNPAKLNLIAALPRITRIAVLARTEANAEVSAANPAGESVLAYHTFYAPVRMNGELRLARLVVQEQKGGRYAYDLQQSGLVEERSPAEPARIPGDIRGASQTQAGLTAMTVAQLRDAVNAVDRPGWNWSKADPAAGDAFARWFGSSQVVTGDGQPKVVYHGTADGFWSFDKARLSESTGHMSAPLGFFFAEDRASAEGYARLAADGVPADERVVDAFLSIQHPFRMTVADLMQIESKDEAAALRMVMQRQGYDGIHVTDAGKGQWIAFEPEQIKSATENIGTFDRASSDLRFSKPDPAAVIDAIDERGRGVGEGIAARLKDMFRGLKPENLRENTRPAWLGALTLRHLAELGGDLKLRQVGEYADLVQKMATARNIMQEEVSSTADAWEKFQRKDRAGADATANLMHDTTIEGVDPSKDYAPLRTGTTKRGPDEAVTPESIARRKAAIAKDMRQAGSPEARTRLEAESKRLDELLAQERRRREQYPALVRRFQALPEAGQKLYGEVRDAYGKQSENMEEALVARIDALEIDGQQKAAMVAQVRQQFESAKVNGPYFPLQRFGQFWISAESPAGEPMFTMYERVESWREALRDLPARGFKVKNAGRKLEKARGLDGASGGFMADLQGILETSGVDKDTRDEVYQLYLRTLPDLSVRKHQIHRKATAGYSNDALRAFSSNMFHGSFQVARLRYAHELAATLRDMEKAVEGMTASDPERAAKAGALYEEMTKRNEWVMNPRDSKAVSSLTSIGFAWYLGATPAAALVNLTQTAIVSFPVLAARFGAGKAFTMLSSATGLALRTATGDITRNLTADEQAAYKLWRESGVIDKSQAHNLAGLSETDTRAFNPHVRRAMEIISWGFHKTEVVNREATALAAFRLAREAGQSFNDAVKYAGEVVTESHFDYSNANRARWMQSNAAKVLLLFRQYSLNMTWFLWRNLYQSLKGEAPEVRKEARIKLGGVLGMTGVFAGAMGMPLMSVMFGLAEAAAAAFGDDDDEPFDAEVAFRNFLADMLGPDVARVLAKGPVDYLTGANISGRVSLNDLWLREPNRELEGQAQADYLLEQAAGPLFGGMLVNTLRGMKQIEDGHTWRGIETMMPKAVKDGMKSVRYATQGVNTLKGDPVIEDLSVGGALLQLAGFSPASLSERYEGINAAKGYEEKVLGRRSALLNAYAMAWRAGDADTVGKVLEKMRAFNQAQPALAINSATIRNSLQARMRYSSRAEGGVVLNPKIAVQAREQARFAE